MNVEILEFSSNLSSTGIGRYLEEISRHLQPLVSLEIKKPRLLWMEKRFSFLKYIPVGIIDHQPGSIVHYPQIMGCAIQLWKPLHPAVATVHDIGVFELPEESRMLDPVARQLLRLSIAGLKRVDKIVAVSEFTRQGIIKHLGIPEERVVTIHSGIDHELFQPNPDARKDLIGHYRRLAVIASSPWLLYVGSELPRKNIGLILQALGKVRDEIPDIRLIKIGFAGGEKYRHETLKVVSELGLEDHLLIFEGIKDYELSLFYSAADIFVTASKLEGFGFPVLEAMACGTPVICTRAGSLPEIAGCVAEYFPSEDAQILANLILVLLKQPESKRLMKSKGVLQSAAFSWMDSALRLYNFYENL